MKMIFTKRFLVLLLFAMLVHSKSLWAQRPQVDSLRSLLKTSISAERRIDAMTELSYELYDFEDSAAFSLAKLALSEALAVKYARGEKYANTLIGLGYLNQGEYHTAVSCFRKSDAIVADNVTRGITGYNLTLLGNMYRDLGKYDSAQISYSNAIEVMGGEGSTEKKLATTYKNFAHLDMLRWKNEEAILKLEKAEVIALKASDTYILVDIWSMYGKVYENLLDFDKARVYFLKMCAAAEEQGDLYHLIMCDLDNAEFAYRRGDFSSSLTHCFNALKKSDRYYYPPQRAEIYFKIGDVYAEFAQYDLALKYFLESLKITEKLGLVNSTANTYSAMAWIYKDEFNFPMALNYINQSQVIRESIGNEHGISNCHNVRGLIYYLQKKYDASLDEFNESLRIRKAIHHTEGISASIFNMSLIYEDLNQLDKALDFQLQAINIEKNIDNKASLAISYNSVSALLIKLGRLKEAENYIIKAQELAAFTKSRLLSLNNYRMYEMLYEAQGNYKMALKSQKKAQELKDSIYSESSAVKLSEMQALYQLDKKDQEIKLLNQDKQIKDDQLKLQKGQIRQQQIIIFSGIATFLLLCFIAYRTYSYNKLIRQANMSITEQKEEIQAQSEEITEAYNTISDINRNLELKIEERTNALSQAYKELDTFFYRSSHDFRRPLTTFMGLAEVAKITVKDKNALELFAKVRETANNLDKMLVKLQSISDVGAQELVYKEVMLKEIFDNVCDAFKEQLVGKGIKTSSDINLQNAFLSYPAMIKIIIDNLVENAISFSGKHDPFIKLKASEENDSVVLAIIDNGQGIDQQYQDRIFEMYFRGSEQSKGNGLGLFIVKKSVEKLGGKITFASEYMRGSTFTITLPRNQQHNDFTGPFIH
ncbi:MAG: tetratricopeptide repeat-containing sensor histidine kinase [Chryseolinea sp.]